MTPYGVKEIGQHWFRLCLVAWLYQAIAWTNVDLSSVGASDIHLRPLSYEGMKIVKQDWKLHLKNRIQFC